MNSTFLKTDKLRNKGGILTFLIISLACWVIYFLDTVAFYSGLLENKDVEIPFEWLAQDVLAFVQIAAPILFFIYVLAFYKNKKATVLVPIIFAVLFVTWLPAPGIEYGAGYLVIRVLISLSFLAGAVLSLFGLTKLAFVMVPTVSGGLLLLSNSMSKWEYVERFIEVIDRTDYLEPILRAFTDYIALPFVYLLLDISFMLALILFGAKNNIPKLIGKESASYGYAPPPAVPIQIGAVEKANEIEAQLRDLDYRRRIGAVTEEEYRLLRANILSKI